MTVDSVDKVASNEAAAIGWTLKRLALVLAILIGFGLGMAGWILPSYGGSLVVPTAIVFGIGAAVALVGAILAVIRPGPVRGSLAFSLAVAVFTLLASFWTFVFALPASLEWDSGATHAAQLTLTHVALKAKNGVAPLQPCDVVTHGSVGSLRAPYRECAIYTPEGHFVTYASMSTSHQGLAYTDRGAATFEDQCSRHLVGKWWMFTPDEGGTGSCPLGYDFHGGA
jgi:hypothetical protein